MFHDKTHEGFMMHARKKGRFGPMKDEEPEHMMAEGGEVCMSCGGPVGMDGYAEGGEVTAPAADGSTDAKKKPSAGKIAASTLSSIGKEWANKPPGAQPALKEKFFAEGGLIEGDGDMDERMRKREAQRMSDSDTDASNDMADLGGDEDDAAMKKQLFHRAIKRMSGR